jgi:hypothetical protein
MTKTREPQTNASGRLVGSEENAYTLGVQALLWGHPLVCYARTSEAGVRAGAVHVNAFRLHTELKTAADRFVVTPNNVTIDSYAWPTSVAARSSCTSRR